jgi:pimeloyl-ACP methyl ester carboxylesterase
MRVARGWSGARWRGVAGLACLAWTCVACVEPAPRSTSLQLSACRLDGLGVEARCGSLSVFENRRTQQGRRIDLKLAVIPALSASPGTDPLFLLAGGPGQAATEAGPQLTEAALHEVLRRRDIVLVDQRGTGGSHALRCKGEEELTLAERFAPSLELPETVACRAALDADPSQYTTDVAMDDLDEARAALGYERINLWGGSYGTRAALVYLRQHPERVRSLVLDGLAPFALELPLFVAQDGQRALDLLYQDCEKDADCAAAFPRARAQLSELLARLDQGAAEIQLKHPRTGVPQSLRIEREGLAAALLNLLYVPQLAGLIPLAVEQALHADFSTLVASIEAFSSSVAISAGMFLSVACAEDLARISDADAERETRATFLGSGWLARLREQCGAWQAAQLAPSYFEAIAGKVPSLLLSGNLDPVTPPRWGELVAAGLQPSRHIVVPGGGHGVSTLGCVPKLITRFLDTLDPAGLDAQCVERVQRPAFFTSLEGPSP